MDRIKNGIHATNDLSTETHKSFPMGKCLNRILTYLDCTKYNEINIDPSHIQNHVSYKK